MTCEKEELQALFSQLTSFKSNRFHPLVWINGDPEIGEGTFIGAMSEVNAKGSRIVIGKNCDIASFVSINCADSHKRCIGLEQDIKRQPIELGDCVFVGSHVVIKGGVIVGHHSVIAAGTILDAALIPPYSLVFGNPSVVRPGYYLNRFKKNEESGE